MTLKRKDSKIKRQAIKRFPEINHLMNMVNINLYKCLNERGKYEDGKIIFPTLCFP